MIEQDHEAVDSIATGISAEEEEFLSVLEDFSAGDNDTLFLGKLLSELCMPSSYQTRIPYMLSFAIHHLMLSFRTS